MEEAFINDEIKTSRIAYKRVIWFFPWVGEKYESKTN